MYITLQYHWIDISNLYLKHEKPKKIIGFQKAGRLGPKKINKYSSCVNRIDRQYTNKFGKIELRVYTSLIAYGKC